MGWTPSTHEAECQFTLMPGNGELYDKTKGTPIVPDYSSPKLVSGGTLLSYLNLA